MDEYILSANPDAPEDWAEQVRARQDVSIVASDMRCMSIKCSKEIAKKLDKKFKYLKVEYVCPDEMFGQGNLSKPSSSKG